MAETNKKLTVAVETYFADLGRTFASGGATGERSSYGLLHGLLSAVGATLKPKVFCVGELAYQGAGHPDFGLYSTNQVQRGKPREGQMPERGVVEVKSVDDDAWLTAAGDQVSRYWGRYRLVLVTNMRDFVLMGEDAAGRPAKLETFRVADSADDFLGKLERPRAFAGSVGAGLGEYLARAFERPYSPDERVDMGYAKQCLGESTFSIWLNARAYWSNVPADVWHYRLVGYQVLKNWLSYRERTVLGRALLDHEVQHFTNIARRITEILSLTRAEPSRPRQPVREAD